MDQENSISRSEESLDDMFELDIQVSSFFEKEEFLNSTLIDCVFTSAGGFVCP